MRPLDLLVFTQYPRAYAPKRFNEEAEKLGVRVKVIGYRDLEPESRLPEAKYVIFREPNARGYLYNLRDGLLKTYLGKSKILNQESYLKWPVLDKLTQTLEFENAGTPHIELLTLEEAKYPFVVKSKLGSHGDHVFKIKNKENLREVFAKGYKKEDLLVQEFQTAGFDLRVIVLGGRVLGVMKRTPKEGEFLSNYSQGGKVEKFGSDQEVETVAIKVAEHFRLDFAGVDLMKSNNGEWKVLEVNRACQFQGFESCTKLNVAKEIINFGLA